MSNDKRAEFVEQQLRFRERTEKLFLLLNSGHDGEALAAARALLRHLESAGIDIHRAAKALALAAGTGADVLKAKASRELAAHLLATAGVVAVTGAFIRGANDQASKPSN